MATFLSAVTKASSGSAFELVEQGSERVLVPALEIAVDSATRKKGLLGRDGLDEGAGLVIAPTNAVHTFFMRFPIDIVFATKAGRVVKVAAGGPGVANRRGAQRLCGHRAAGGRGAEGGYRGRVCSSGKNAPIPVTPGVLSDRHQTRGSGL